MASLFRTPMLYLLFLALSLVEAGVETDTVTAFSPQRPTPRPAPDGTLRPAATMVLAEATQAPDLRRGIGVVLRRQGATTMSTTTLTMTYAPDETCGYVSASPGIPLTCSQGRGCRWEVKTIKHIMCADQDMFLRCMDRVVALDTRSCDDTCRSNIQILKCTDTISPFCRTYLYPDDVTGYTCHPNQLPTTRGVAFTWLDQPNRQLATVTVIAPAPRTSSTPDSTSATSSADPTAKGGNSHNSNIPVIVGGLVGGLVVLILAAVAVFFIKKKYRAGKDTDSGAATEPTFDRFGLGAHGGAHNRDDENERSPLSRNPPMVSSHYARDSVSAISQQSDSRMSMQSSGTFVGYQGMGPGGQPETIQEMATDQQIHEMGTDYKGHEM
ncbi:hypothetical protein RB597_002881 [Gaeumannomyces tritici]